MKKILFILLFISTIIYSQDYNYARLYNIADTMTARLSTTTGNWRIYENSGAGSPNILAGYSGNTMTGVGSLFRANVIAGGGLYDAINSISGNETRYATISGGYDNYINGDSSTTDIDGAASTIAGGAHHEIRATHATISGGSYGYINEGCDYSTIVGGVGHTITGEYGTVLGGLYNSAGKWSTALGRYATVTGIGSFGMCAGEVGRNYTLNSDATFGGSYAYWMLTGGKVGITDTTGGFDKDHLPDATLDITSPGASDSSGGNHVLRLSDRFGFRLSTDDVTFNLDRYNSGVWQTSPIMTFRRDNGIVNIPNYLGVNTASPTDIFEISGGHLKINNTTPTIRLNETDQTVKNWIIRSSSGDLSFNVSNTAFSTVSPKVAFLNTGSVGIGTESPDEKFEIEFGDANKDVEIGVGTTDADVTFITLRSPNGTKYYVTVDDSGNFVSSASKP